MGSWDFQYATLETFDLYNEKWWGMGIESGLTRVIMGMNHSWGEFCGY